MTKDERKCPKCKQEIKPFGKKGTSIQGFFYCKECKIFTHGIFVFSEEGISGVLIR